MFPALITSVLIPIFTDLIKSAAPALSRKWIGVSVDDQIKLDTTNIERLKALAALDAPGGTPSQWVIDFRAAYRYVAATVLILGGLTAAYMGISSHDATVLTTGVDLASSPFGFIFGERLVLSYRAGGK